MWNYYQQSAPEKALPQGPRSPIQMGLKQFKVRPVTPRSAWPMTSLVKIDPAQKRLLVGDAQTKSLDILTPAGVVRQTIKLESGPVSLTVRKEGLYVTLIGHIFPSDEK